jgi:hypothetical protein
MCRLSDGDLDRLKYRLMGTCDSIDVALESLDLQDVTDSTTASDQLLDGNPSVESCAGCDWWFESAMLTFNEEECRSFCDDCREKSDE